MRLYIDDIRNPKTKFDKITRSTLETLDFMERNGCPNYISFDHDLGGEDTSMNIIKWMIEMDLDLNGEFIPDSFEYNIHSANPVGKANIEGYLKSYLKEKKLTRDNIDYSNI